jgi:putative DNA primase/helicase
MGTQRGPISVTNLPGGHEPPPGCSETSWLGDRVVIFKSALRDYKNRGFA